MAPTSVVAKDAGQWLYTTHCSSCHGAYAQGTDAAPPLIGKSAADIHFMLDTGRMPATDPDVNEIRKSPRFTQVQMNEIVRYVQSFSPGADTSLPRVSGGNAAHGRALYFENCAHCHGAAADGASVGSRNVAPSLMHSTVFQVAEAIRAGPTVMPRFGRDMLTDADVDDIARYINVLQTQYDKPQSIDSGGVALAHIGPVAEGLVAWLFGLGVLTLFVRLIGTTK
ncbi:MAG: c-type cytochrome [Candidatus Eremiobacteraeota bacterium]|nr:c-type cytochrome [Candidatus Eremiobacteraeota bacterium]